jgi:hypothetical protein
MQSFGRNGRLGNQLFQFFFLNIVQNRLNCKISIPRYEENIYFDPCLDNEYLFVDSELSIPGSDLEADIGLVKQYASVENLNINGYFQYHTSQYSMEDKNLLFELFHPTFNKKNESIIFKKLLIYIQNFFSEYFKNKFLIVLHVRRSDYLNSSTPEFFCVNFECFYHDLLKINSINSMKNLVIYIASDDIDYCLFSAERWNLKILTSRDFSQIDPLVLDFYFMIFADVLYTANSSLSIMASMLNSNSKIFRRPHINQTEYAAFHPWNTPILLKRSLL